MNNADELRIARAAETGLHRKQFTDTILSVLSFIFIVGLIAGVAQGPDVNGGFVIAGLAFFAAVFFFYKRTNGNI